MWSGGLCGERTRVCAEWLSSEAFRWFTVCEKLRIAGKHLQDKSSRHAGILEAMGPVFKDVETMAFFTDRVGQVEVVRNHELERLFFLLPANHRSKKDAKMIQNSITKVIVRCPREDQLNRDARFRHFVRESEPVLRER